MEFVPLVAFAALVSKFVDFARFVTARDYRSAVTQTVAWAVGVAGALLFRATSFATAIPVGDRSLATLSVVDAIVFGIVGASTASLFVDYKQALDATDTAIKPPMLGNKIRTPRRSPKVRDEGHVDVLAVLVVLVVVVLILVLVGVVPSR